MSETPGDRQSVPDTVGFLEYRSIFEGDYRVRELRNSWQYSLPPGGSPAVHPDLTSGGPAVHPDLTLGSLSSAPGASVLSNPSSQDSQGAQKLGQPQGRNPSSKRGLSPSWGLPEET